MAEWLRSHRLIPSIGQSIWLGEKIEAAFTVTGDEPQASTQSFLIEVRGLLKVGSVLYTPWQNSVQIGLHPQSDFYYRRL